MSGPARVYTVVDEMRYVLSLNQSSGSNHQKKSRRSAAIHENDTLMSHTRTLEELSFDNKLCASSRGVLRQSSISFVRRASVSCQVSIPRRPELIDLDPEQAKRPECAGVFGGSLLVPGMEPLAMLYSGHQFGVYVPQLGDGRAILLGEVRNERGEKWDPHLKGAGLTPFSREGDGRAVLRSTIREYLCSEAMHSLRDSDDSGRSVSSGATTKSTASRSKPARCSCEWHRLICASAPLRSSITVSSTSSSKSSPTMSSRTTFPHSGGWPNKYARFFSEVVERTAKLIAQWQAVGWAHGVMNTDNMSIHGITLDYGPFGFMDDYDPGFICNHSDHNGRYAFNQQPYIGLWNLSCLAQALLPLAQKEDLKAALDRYTPSAKDSTWS